MDGLFEIPPELLPAAPADPDGKPSMGRRRTQHHLKVIGMGYHPITKEPHHQDATTARTVEDKAPGLRCDTCSMLRHNGSGFLKCTAQGGRYATHAEATDMRRWWPACRLYDPSTAPE